MKFLVLLAALGTLVTPAIAGPADDLVGTWECRVPGAPPTKTPPIVWFGASSADGTTIETTVDLDGFGREVSGISDLASDKDGWWKVQPQDGQTFMVKPMPVGGKQTTPAMYLKRASGMEYRCMRLPRYS